MVLFSIGIPAFKGKFLKECITSILDQTYKNFELIIIDDCSPEPIEGIVRGFTDSRIRFLRNDRNKGAEKVVDNWNKCLEQTSGEYFILMGDDDRMEVNYLEEFLSLITKYPGLDVYHCRSKLIDEASVPFSITPINPEFENCYDYILSCITATRQQYISDFVYKSESLKSKGGFYNLPLAWGSDYLTAFIACNNKGIAHTNKAVFNYRSNQYSITSSGNNILKRQATLKYYNWINAFLATTPTNEDDQLKHSMIKLALAEQSEGAKIGIIIQILGESNIVSGLIKAYSKRKTLEISLKDIFKAAIQSLSRKLTK